MDFNRSGTLKNFENGSAPREDDDNDNDNDEDDDKDEEERGKGEAGT